MGCRLNHFFESNVGFDREFLYDGVQDVIDIKLTAVISVHASSCSLLLFKCLFYSIDLVELVKLGYNLAKDRLAVADEQVQEFLVLLHIVCRLLANQDRIVIFVRNRASCSPYLRLWFVLDETGGGFVTLLLLVL